jgi:exodeoxyribonuclease-3
LSWNVNGIRAAISKGFPAWFERENADIVCLQETKAMPGQVADNIGFAKGYEVFWNNPERRGYAGVSVLTRKKPFAVHKDFSGKIDTEGRALIVDLKKFILINVYFPNGGRNADRLAYKLEFYDRFLEYVDGIKNRNIVICGDVNTAHKEIDLARPKENSAVTGFLPEERAWIDKLISRGFVDTFRHFNKESGQYSWWDYKTRARERNVGWRIDYFFVTEKLAPKLKDAFISNDVHGSDHCPVGIELDL